MSRSAACVLRIVAPAFLAGALGGSCLAETTPASEAVVAECARLFVPATALQDSLDAVPGLTRLPMDSFAPAGEHGRALRVALAYNAALEGIIGSDLIAPVDQLQRALAMIEADTPWLHSLPGEGSGVAAYADDAGTLFVVERAVTTGRQGRQTVRCLFIAPPGAAPLTPGLPDTLVVTGTPSISSRGFSVSAFQGQIPYDGASQSDASAGFSMVTMPVPPGTPISDFAEIGGVTIFRQSTSNRSSE